MRFQAKYKEIQTKVLLYMQDEVNRYRIITLIVFLGIITILAWQSDDAYHAYVMAKNLVLGDGFVYNVGERASATSCPLFTLIIAFGYFFIRKMFVVSLLICILFSGLAYKILCHDFCRTKKQVFLAFIILLGSFIFISYTTSGLENCLLYFLSALFLKYYFKTETYNGRTLFIMAILISLIAMTRMDSVLMFIPMIIYIYLSKRNNVSFFKAAIYGFLGLMPFILWILFSVFYYGFPFPNTAYVKLGTEIPFKDYFYRGLQYIITSSITDLLLLLIPATMVIMTIIVKKARYLYISAGIILYVIYLIRIGGDFMVGRHFTVLFFIALCTYFNMENERFGAYKNPDKLKNSFLVIAMIGLIYAGTMQVITSQFLFGNVFNSPIADERGGYFRFTSLFNNAISVATTGEMVIRNAWNEEGVEELRGYGIESGILEMVPGITKYYNNDMYLNDLYALGDPFLSKLPAVREDNWRIGHMWREPPAGYGDTVIYGKNIIENKDIAEYYEIIKLITRGDLFSKERISAIVRINMGQYDYLIENYKNTLDENCQQITEE